MTYPAEVLADSPLVYYRLDEASGNAADSSGNGRTGTANGGLTYSQTSLLLSDPDPAILFNGSTGYFSRTHESALNPAAITLECWVYITGAPTNNGNMIGKNANSGYRIRVNNNRSVSFLDRGGTNHLQSAASAVALNTQTHIVCVGDGAGLEIFVNGVSIASNATAYGAGASAGDFRVGMESSEFFAGVIDEAAVYGTRLSSTRILAHYNAGFSLGGTASLTLDATADLTINPAMGGTATLALTSTADLTVPKPLAGTASLTLSNSGALSVPKPLAGTAALTLLTAADLDVFKAFQISLTAVALLGPAHRFYIRLGVIQNPLPQFTVRVRSRRALPRFTVHVRALPSADPFDADVQVAAGHVDTV